MQNSALIDMAKEYVILGSVLVVLCVVVFLLGYMGIYKGRMKGEKNVRFVPMMLWGSFVVYIVVVIGVTLVRSTYMDSTFYLRLFSSYKAAWISASYVEWRNLFLNIMMFVPLGIYLPLLSKMFRKGYRVYLVGFICSLEIEVIQYLCGKGVAEIDDLFNNTLGTMIGYGIFVMIFTVVTRRNMQKQWTWKRVMCLQLPLVAMVISFTSLYVIYQNQEFGNLTCQRSYDIEMNDTLVETKLELSTVNETAAIYEITIYSTEELVTRGNEILAYYDDCIDESRNSIYENTVVFSSESGDYSLWMDYKGGGYWLINYKLNQEAENIDTTLSEEEVEAYLEAVGVVVPEEAIFDCRYDEMESSGINYYADLIVTGNTMITGDLSCDFNANGEVIRMHNYMNTYEYTTEKELYSEQEIYDMILKGEFSYNGVSEFVNTELMVEDIELIYWLDSKGYYQPVFEVEILHDEDVSSILMPAIRE